MLVLSRKQGERIVISNTIIVTILEVKGNAVRIGVEAPRDIPVHREEVQAVILNTRQQSRN
jgi:carbon storage regulator